jgi:hypothetical protein
VTNNAIPKFPFILQLKSVKKSKFSPNISDVNIFKSYGGTSIFIYRDPATPIQV